MADLRALQNTSQPQAARLQAIPAPRPTPSAITSTAQGLSGLTSLVGRVVASERKREAEAGEAAFVGSLTDSLVKAQQAGQTNPKFNTATEQRKIVQRAIAENPQYAETALTAFKSATGLEVAGVSNEETQRVAMQNEAWAAGFGSPDASNEVNEKQLEIYTNIQRESEILAYESQQLANQEARGRVDKASAKTKFVQQANKLANLEFESTNIDMEADVAAIKDGTKTVDQVRQEWAMSRIRLSQQLNSFGVLKNDEDITAIMQPVFDLYDLADKNFTSKFESEEVERKIKTIQDKATASILANNPEASHAIAVSNLFGHAPGLSTLMSKTASQLLTQGPADVREITPKDADDLQKTLKSALQDPNAREEAIGTQGKLVDHIARNGMDYTDEEKFKLAKALNNPEIWAAMAPEKRQEALFAFESYMVDVVDNIVREAQGETISTTTFEGVTGFREAALDTRVQSIRDFADLVVDATGVRYEIKPGAQLTRQLRNKVININRELGEKVNPMLDVVAGAAGISNEEAASKYFNIGMEEEATGDVVEPTSQEDFKAEFIRVAMEEGSTQEEAEALYESVNQPAEDAVSIGGVTMSAERARQLLSTPVGE